MKKQALQEYNQLINEWKNHPKVLEMKNYKHHGITRYDHCVRVSYHTFQVTKKLHLNYVSATKAAMLHDFFTNEVEELGPMKRFRNHSKIAAKNAKKYFGLTPLEEDIIERHMFPITITPPKYLESWIVDIIDDIASIYERGTATKRRLQPVFHIIVFFLFTMIR
ncbi:MAG: HD domain-containing protein [Bacilli bacterium]|nr:HD domain-containing protein [Bacilli bacterium]